MIDNKKALTITEHKSVGADGSIIQFVIWKVPTPVPPTEHGFKYRMVYAQNGIRVVGFDNERGKGDHIHLDGLELPYRFTTIHQLIEDFLFEVEKRRQS
ncbi:toxin-antitoxin system TumE family protein [Agrobacterium tumefaciens]|uniref:toxin-antitoxin system TumE family protein n=1 Tax=Agrobacterium tumefaciens TaxID=358 RepID=UPI003013AE8D